MSTPDWPWSDADDAVVAAPRSHRILIENDAVRVLEIIIAPGDKEPFHTHRWPSVMLVDQRTRIRYYGADKVLEFESPEYVEPTLGPTWLEPEGLHAVENLDPTTPYHGIRIEIKG